MISLDEVTELQNSSLFDLVELVWRPYEAEPAFVMAVTLEMDLDLLIVSRNLFTILDFLSNIGGLASIVASTLGLIVTIFNWHGLVHTFIIAKLFTTRISNQEAKNRCF